MHNFIRMNQSKEDIFNKEQVWSDEKLGNNRDNIETKANLAKEDGRKMNEFCDKIAEEMWQDYVQG